LIEFRYHKNKKKQWRKTSVGDGDGEEFFPCNGEWGGDGGVSGDGNGDSPPRPVAIATDRHA